MKSSFFLLSAAIAASTCVAAKKVAGKSTPSSNATPLNGEDWYFPGTLPVVKHATVPYPELQADRILSIGIDVCPGSDQGHPQVFYEVKRGSESLPNCFDLKTAKISLNNNYEEVPTSYIGASRSFLHQVEKLKRDVEAFSNVVPELSSYLDGILKFAEERKKSDNPFFKTDQWKLSDECKFKSGEKVSSNCRIEYTVYGDRALEVYIEPSSAKRFVQYHYREPKWKQFFKYVERIPQGTGSIEFPSFYLDPEVIKKGKSYQIRLASFDNIDEVQLDWNDMPHKIIPFVAE